VSKFVHSRPPAAPSAGPRTRMHPWLSVLVIALALALGWLGLRFCAGVDVTANQRHGLTTGTRAALAALDGPIEILAVLGPDETVRDAVQDLIARYQDLKPDLTLRFINPDTDPAAARALNAAPGGELIVRTGAPSAPETPGAPGAHGANDAAQREQRLQRLDERALTGALRKLAREGSLNVAFVIGHGERDPAQAADDDWQVIAERLDAVGVASRAFSFVTEPRVPETVDVLVIAAPERPWLPGEVTGVLEHVRSGGNLLWLIESPIGYPIAQPDADASDAPAAATPRPGLSALASELGVVTEPGRVIDTASQALVQDSPDFVVLGAHPDHPVTRALGAPLLLPQARALAVTPLAGQTTLPLLATPESSWTETGELAGEVTFDAAEGEVEGPLLLGVTIERETDGTHDAQRIAIIGDADFGASRFVGNGSNAAFVEALLVWLSGEDRALEFVTTAAPDARLELSPRLIVVLSVISLIVLPLVLLGIALGVRLMMRRG